MGYEIIKELAKQRKMRLDDVAAHAGISYNSLSKIIRNTIKEPKYSTLSNIAEALGMTIDELNYAINPTVTPPHMLKAPVEITNQEQRIIEKYRLLDDHGRELVDTVLGMEVKRAQSQKAIAEQATTIIDYPDVCQLPRFDKVSAGNGEVVFNNSAESMVTIRATEAAKKADYIVDVHGDSMEPEYQDGDIVLVKKKEEIEQGKTGIFILNGDAYIKNLGTKGLISLNKKYPEIVIKETDGLWLFGEVVGKAELVQG